eukprot:4946223-Prymnesium_polylepis.1
MRGWGKGLGWFFVTPLAHLVPGGLLDDQQQNLRQNSSIERRRRSPSPPVCAWQPWKGGVIALGRARRWDLGR